MSKDLRTIDLDSVSSFIDLFGEQIKSECGVKKAIESWFKDNGLSEPSEIVIKSVINGLKEEKLISTNLLA